MTAKETKVNLRPRVVEFVKEHIVASRTAIRDHLQLRALRAQDFLSELVERGILARASWGKRVYYLEPSREWQVCDCDGRCTGQLVVLRDSKRRRLFGHLLRLGQFNSRQIRRATTGWSDWCRSSLHHAINQFEQVGLLSRFQPGHSDRRLTWYRVESLLPPIKRYLNTDPSPFSDEKPDSRSSKSPYVRLADETLDERRIIK